MRVKLYCFVFVGLATSLALPPRSAHAADVQMEDAREHFRKGQQWFDLGRWDDAIEEFEKAYSIRNDPTFLFNMAQACRRKGDVKRALDLYKNYLMKAPKSPQRAEIEERIAALQKQADESERNMKGFAQTSPYDSPGPTTAVQPPAPAPVPIQPPAPSPVPPPAPATAQPQPYYLTPTQPYAQAPAAQAGAPAYPYAQSYSEPVPEARPAPVYVQAPLPVQSAPAPSEGSPGRGLRITGIILLSTGAAAVIAGAACGAAAVSVSDTVSSDRVFRPENDTLGKTYQTLQWVGYGIGAGLIVTGSVLYGIGVAAKKQSSVALVPTLTPTSAGLAAQGSF